MGDPVAELRSAVEAAASALRDGADPPVLTADPGAPAEARVRRLLHERGDAARAGARRAAARDRREARGGARPKPRGHRREGGGRGARLPQPLPVGGLVPARRRRAGIGGRRPRPAGALRGRQRADQRRVRLGQPDRADHGRGREGRRAGRLDRADPGVRRPLADPRVLRQRPRRADRPLRRLDRRADEGGACPRGRLRGRVRHRDRQEPRAGGCQRGRSRCRRAPRDCPDAGRRGGDAPPLRRRLRHVVLGACPP